MHINKKAYTSFIITVLTLSVIIAAMPMASAEITTVPFVVTKGGTTAVAGGPVGTKVDVVGNTTSGFASPFSTVTVYWDALSGKVLGTGSANVDGAYRITVTIPAAVFGTHYLVVNDGETESEGAPFAVSARLVVNTIPPTAGTPKALPGDSVTVTGDGFAANDAITLTFNQTTDPSIGYHITTPVITTNGTGSFSATIQIPAIAVADFDTYDVTAEDEDTNTATDQVVIDYYILCAPPAGPRGITITISGRIEANVAYEIRFNGAPIATGTTASDGSYANTYTIPGVLSETTYAVDIVWATVETRSTTFQVTASPTITLIPDNGIAGAIISITGSGFSGLANITLYFGTTVVNSTAMGTGFGRTTAGGALPAGLTFVVPSLTPGMYSVSVVDQYNAASATGVYFTINPTPVFMVATRATEYVRMDFISLVSSVTTAVNVDLVITDPTGLIFYNEYLGAGDWQKIGASWQIPYAELYLTWWPITSDAPLGTWNFTCYAAGTTTILDTNLFTVAAKPDMQDVLDKLDGLEANITDVITTAKGDIVALINTKSGQIVADISTLDGKITSIDGDLVTISTSIGEVQTAVSALDLGTMGVDITSIKGDVATIKTNLGTVTTAVSALDAKVTSLSGDVATVSTNLGTLQGTVTSIEGTVATIDTEVGTVKADIGAVQADVTDIKAKPDVDMTPAWIAVVLSLIAAIAACFAVVTIRQKIAG